MKIRPILSFFGNLDGVKINGVRSNSDSNNGTPNAFHIEVSNDSLTWDELPNTRFEDVDLKYLTPFTW